MQDRSPGDEQLARGPWPNRPWWFPPAALTQPFVGPARRAGYDVRDPDVVLRIEVQILYALLAGLSALLYAYTLWSADAELLTTLFLLLAAGNGLVLVMLRVTGRLRLVGHATLALALVTMGLATYLTGGLRMTNVAPFFITLAASVFLLGWHGLGWAALSLLVPLGFQLAGDAGVRFPDYVPPAARQADAFMTWLVALVVVALFTLYYEAARELSVRRRAQAEAARSQFLANVSHELRTPLHAIMGMTHQALRAELPGEARQALETTQQNAEDLLVLINDLVMLGSMERDSFALEPRDFDPVAELERVASIVRFRCEQQGLAFKLTVAPDASRWVHGDGDRLRQVLLNLGSNAVKYTDRGSVELAIEAERLDAGGDEQARATELGHRMVFTVADTGLGIQPEDRSRIFGPFTRAHHSPARARRGVGLGLHIVQEIVAAMGGRIELDSEPGAGSKFRVVVEFDRAHGDPPTAAEIPAAEQPRPNLRVLVVDDDALNVRMATTMLEELGHQVLVARDGLQAIERWHAERPELVLMDIQMPELDGEEATRRIRERERAEGLEPVPIIAVTGHGTTQDRDQYLAAGATACLFKPFRFEDLERILASAAATRQLDPN